MNGINIFFWALPELLFSSYRPLFALSPEKKNPKKKKNHKIRSNLNRNEKIHSETLIWMEEYIELKNTGR